MNYFHGLEHHLINSKMLMVSMVVSARIALDISQYVPVHASTHCYRPFYIKKKEKKGFSGWRMYVLVRVRIEGDFRFEICA